MAIRSFVIREIATLNPVQDHQRILFLSSRYDFPFDTTRALEFALFRTFAVPSISKLLDQTSEFRERTQRRYDDTDIIVSEILEHGYDSERGRAAIRRMNQIHGRFKIANEDFLYVLSTFIFEPIRWISANGWRPLLEKEKLAYFYFWKEVGKRMNIKNIPDRFEDYEAFNLGYELQHFQFTETNARVGTSTRELFVSWFPKFMAPLTRKVIHSLLDDRLRKSFGYPSAPTWIRKSVNLGLKARRWGLRLLPPRKSPVLRTRMTHLSHPNGYSIPELGPPKLAGVS